MTEITRSETKKHDLFAQMRRDMDELFRSWWGSTPSTVSLRDWTHGGQFLAPVDCHETEAEYVVRMDAPGMVEKDLKISVQGDVLTLSGERRDEKTEEKGQRRYTERSFGMFTRSLTLPMAVKVDQVRARYKDGVLEVRLPKSEKTPVREIKVEAGT